MTEGMTNDQILYFAIAVAAAVGIVFGWLIRAGKCKTEVTGLQAILEADKEKLREKDQELSARDQTIASKNTTIKELVGALDQARCDTRLYQIRWQDQRKKARRLLDHQIWIRNLQQKLAYEKTSRAQNRQYAESMAEKYAVTHENLIRVHSRLTQVSHQNQNLLDWVHVFQNKLKKRNTDYGQLRSFADALKTQYAETHDNLQRTHQRLTAISARESKWKDWALVFQNKLKKRNIEYGQLRQYASTVSESLSEYKCNLQRVHTRLSEVDKKEQPLRSWIRVFQAKLKQRRTQYEQLRHYADEVGSQLQTTKANLKQVHNRLTSVQREADYMKRQVGGVVVAEVPRVAEVPDSQPLRLLDKIRLFGTSQSEIFGRLSNQIRESRLESAQKERVLVNSCEEKDAIISDLKGQIRRLENRSQTGAKEAPLDQAVKIKELESELGRAREELKRLPDLDKLIQEHELTISAFRNKLEKLSPANTLWQDTAFSATGTAPKKKAISKSTQEKDDLKMISGVGPKLEKILNKQGLYTFAQVAALTEKDIEILSSHLGSFKDRIYREDWVAKARELHNRKYEDNI